MKLAQIIFFLFFSVSLWAFEVPELTGPVVDQAGLLDARTESEITALARHYSENGIAQIQVLTVKDLQGEEIEQASIQIADKWKLGTQNQDNGILMLISLNPRKIRIEVGQGLEGDVPDVIAKRIIRDVMAPAMKSGDISLGIYLGVREIINYVEPETKAEYQKKSQKSSGGKTFKNLIFIIFIILVLIMRVLGGSSVGRRSGLGYGGFGGGGFGSGGGGWSGGGGGFSGGGSSGNW